MVTSIVARGVRHGKALHAVARLRTNSHARNRLRQVPRGQYRSLAAERAAIKECEHAPPHFVWITVAPLPLRRQRHPGTMIGVGIGVFDSRSTGIRLAASTLLSLVQRVIRFTEAATS